MSIQGSQNSVETKPQAAVTASSLPVSHSVNVIDPNSTYKRSIWQWFHPDDGPIERKLILKLDLFILSFACIGFWVYCLFNSKRDITYTVRLYTLIAVFSSMPTLAG